MPSAIVVGGTGKCGKYLVKELVRSPEWTKVRSVQRTQKEPSFFELNDEEAKEKLEQVCVDFEKLDEHHQAFEGDFTHGFCCLGTTRKDAGSAAAFRRVDLDYVKSSASLMKDAGVGHFLLLSSGGANANSWFLYPQTKGEVEEECRKMGFNDYTVFHPGMLFGRGPGRAAEHFFSKLIPSTFGIHISNVGKAMKKVAEDKSMAGGEIVGNGEMKQLAAEPKSNM